MALTTATTLNIPGGTSSIVFTESSTQIENITYTTGTVITYASEASATISHADMAIFYAAKLAWFNSLLLNFPSIQGYYEYELPVCQIKLYSSSGPNIIQYYQTSTAAPTNLVYNISFDRGALTATFAARSAPITITFQEYLLAFQTMTQFFNQVYIA